MAINHFLDSPTHKSSPMDPLHLCIALGPLAAYLLMIGMINLSRRPFLTSGARDLAALGVAISGFVIAGPMELFLPEAAAQHFGGYVWLLLILLYAMLITFIVLIRLPRLLVYNAQEKEIRTIFEQVVAELDPEARWAGDSVSMPSLGIELHIEHLPVMRNIQITAVGYNQNYAGWRHLERALGRALSSVRTPPNPYGFSLVLFSAMMASMAAYWVLSQPLVVTQLLWDMLRI